MELSLLGTEEPSLDVPSSDELGELLESLDSAGGSSILGGYLYGHPIQRIGSQRISGVRKKANQF